MFLSLFGRSSESASHTVWENDRLKANLDAMEARLVRLIAAYITESKRPDCEPSMRYRVQLPDGVVEYRGTREEAEAVLYDIATGKGKD